MGEPCVLSDELWDAYGQTTVEVIYEGRVWGGREISGELGGPMHVIPAHNPCSRDLPRWANSLRMYRAALP